MLNKEVIPLCNPLSDRAAAWDDVWERLLDEGIVEILCTSTPRLETWGDTCIGHRIPLDEGDRAYAERVRLLLKLIAENDLLLTSSMP